MGMSDIEIATIIVIVVQYLLGAYIIYELTRFIKHRKESIIQCRRPVLTAVFVSICVFRMVIAVPASLGYLCEWGAFTWYKPRAQYFVSDFLGIVMASMFIERMWLLFYDFKFNQANLNLLWKQKIDESQSNKLDFWIDRRKTLGSPKMTSIVLLTLGVLCLFIIYIVPLVIEFDESLHNILILTLWVPVILFCIGLSLMVRRVGDAHFIRNELFYSIAIMIFVATAIVALFLFFMNNSDDVWFDWLWYVIVNAGLGIVCIVMTRWVLNQHYRIQKKVNFVKQQTNDSESGDDEDDGGAPKGRAHSGGRPRTRDRGGGSVSVSGLLGRLRGNSNAKIQLDLRAILKTQEGFEAFIKFLLSEFNVEHMLFLVEVTQFKATLKKKMESLAKKRESIHMAMQKIEADNNSSLRHRPGRRQMRDATVLDEEFVLDNDWLPVHNEGRPEHPFKHALYIHNKYTHPNSKYSINISSDNRHQLFSFFQAKEEEYKAKNETDGNETDGNDSEHDPLGQNTSLPNRVVTRSSETNDDSKTATATATAEAIYASRGSMYSHDDESSQLYSLYYVFDACWAEVWELLETDSFKRFAQTNDCAQIYEMLERRGKLEEDIVERKEATESRKQRSRNVDEIGIEMNGKKVEGKDVPDIVRKSSNSNTNNIIKNNASNSNDHNENNIIGANSNDSVNNMNNTTTNTINNNTNNNSSSLNQGKTVSSPATKLYEKGKLRKPKPRPVSIESRSVDPGDDAGGDKQEKGTYEE